MESRERIEHLDGNDGAGRLRIPGNGVDLIVVREPIEA
jgi:hypothetical protein